MAGKENFCQSITSTGRQCRIAVRSAAKASHLEYLLTGSVDDASVSVEGAGEYFADAAAVLAENGIQLIEEKVYGSAGVREDILAVREREYVSRGLDASLPVTFIEGRPISGAQFAGLQLWGVAPNDSHDSSVTTLEGKAPGRCWKGPGFRMVYFPCMHGLASDGTLPGNAPEQAERMFSNALAALKEQGLSYDRVVRTWIYLARILDGYGEFNRGRTAHHERQGLLAAEGYAFPASTGIQGRCSDHEECFMDVLAVESDGGVEVKPISESSRQPAAFSYGSDFSRATVLKIEGRKTMFISGTASINAAGETVHVDNPELQSLETLMDIGVLLEAEGGSLANICMAKLFCKNVDAYKAYREVTRMLKIPEFPTLPVLADVCRDELLIEIEAVALI